ncbi:hypothetical protein CSUI_005274, partial [Cystoisospora suis]
LLSVVPVEAAATALLPSSRKITVAARAGPVRSVPVAAGAVRGTECWGARGCSGFYGCGKALG